MPEEVDELLDEHPLKPRSSTGIIKPGRKRNLIPILYPCPLSSSRATGTISHRQIEIQKYLHLCIRNFPEEQTAAKTYWNPTACAELPGGHHDRADFDERASEMWGFERASTSDEWAGT